MRDTRSRSEQILPPLSFLLLLSLAGLGCGEARAPETAPAASPSAAAAPSISLREAVASTDPYERARDLAALLPTLGPESIPEIRAALEDHRLELGAAEYELLVRFWASQDPAEATLWTFKRASPLFQLAATRMAIATWAERDPTAAVGAVRVALQEANEEVARVAETALVRGWFQKDRPSLEAYIYDQGAGIQRQRAIFAYVVTLVQAEGPDAAMAWGEAIPEDAPRYRREAFRQVMSGLAWTDMPSAVRFCDRHCDGPWGQALRNVLVLTRLRQGDPGAEVVLWVAETPAPDEKALERKKKTLLLAYGRWAMRAQDEAVAWMREELEAPAPPGWMRMLYGEFARQIAYETPAEAILWAERMDPGKERDLTLVRIARRWRAIDEEAAEAWLASSSLSEPQRAQARDMSVPDYLPGGPSNRR